MMEKKACTVRLQKITKKELPLSCPLTNERLWDAHPRVYLDIEKTGHVVCPYCETKYELV
ncbi:MAG TPA: zinc-finger domain-containing protein [Coxiellaceae bacterium]|nr:zinc-finger domain-containing protein [Coxiellaceae bacterium]